MTRYTGPIRLRLSGPDARRHLDAGRKLAGELDNRGIAVGTLTKRLADGTVVAASQQGEQRQIAIAVPPTGAGGGEAMEEVIHCYIGSPGGLRIFDLGLKQEVKQITGLEPFDVDAVSRDGAIVHMTVAFAGGTTVARVDVPALSAVGVNYDVPSSPSITGKAWVRRTLASPDGTRLLHMFDKSGTLSGEFFSVVEGIGGYLLCNAETMLALRGPIRMTYTTCSGAWTPDSARVFIGAVINTDTDYIAAGTPEVYGDSPNSYIAEFTREGVLVATRELMDAGFTPGGGFFWCPWLLAVNPQGTRLYASYRRYDPFPTLEIVVQAFDITEAGFPVVATHIFPFATHDPGEDMVITHGGKRLAIYGATADAVLELDLEDDALTIVHDTTDTDFDTTITANRHIVGGGTPLQRGPVSRVGQRPDPRRYFLKRGAGTAVLNGYRSFEDPPVYTYDFSGVSVHQCYALVATGTRKREVR